MVINFKTTESRKLIFHCESDFGKIYTDIGKETYKMWTIIVIRKGKINVKHKINTPQFIFEFQNSFRIFNILNEDH